MRYLLVVLISFGCVESKESDLEEIFPPSGTSTDEQGSSSEPSSSEPSSSEPSSSEPSSSEPEAPEDPEDTQGDYPSGPYGWNPSMYWDQSAGSGYWTSDGNTIEDICLPNASGNQVCLKDHYRSTLKDIIFLDFSAMWCGPCNAAAEGEHAFLSHLESNGWKPIWLTVLLEDYSGSTPTQSDAQEWAQTHGLSSDTVLYDPSGEWYIGASGGYPSVHLIHTSNMLIWDMQAGWVGPSDGYWNDWLNFYSGSNGLLEYCAAQQGATD